MTSQPSDVFELLRKLRMDLTNAQGKLSDVLALLGDMNLQDTIKPRCEVCGVQLRGPLSLAEHLHLSHDGPVPAHWVEAERLAGLEWTDRGEPKALSETERDVMAAAASHGLDDDSDDA